MIAGKAALVGALGRQIKCYLCRHCYDFRLSYIFATHIGTFLVMAFQTVCFQPQRTMFQLNQWFVMINCRTVLIMVIVLMLVTGLMNHGRGTTVTVIVDSVVSDQLLPVCRYYGIMSTERTRFSCNV